MLADKTEIKCSPCVGKEIGLRPSLLSRSSDCEEFLMNYQENMPNPTCS